MGVYGDIKQALMVLENVQDLKKNVEQLADLVNDLDKRLVALEAREDVVVTKAQAAAAHAATNSAQRMSETLLERVVHLENTVPKLGKD